MSSRSILAALDKFMAEPKTIQGSESSYAWAPGYSTHEVQVKFPLQVSGEQSGARLLVVGFPRARELKFRLSVCFNAALARLDYTDETHPNHPCDPPHELPPLVTGPHYHSWELNRRFCKGLNAPEKLHLASEFSVGARSFDSILRWFCADTKIIGLPPNHLIELPRPDGFL